jgi:hypothetical protein
MANIKRRSKREPRRKKKTGGMRTGENVLEDLHGWVGAGTVGFVGSENRQRKRRPQRKKK